MTGETMNSPEMTTPPAEVIAPLEVLLDELFAERGNDVRLWPEDEAEAYRELGWSEGAAAARALRIAKAARALYASPIMDRIRAEGVLAAAELPEIQRTDPIPVFDEHGECEGFDTVDAILERYARRLADGAPG